MHMPISCLDEFDNLFKDISDDGLDFWIMLYTKMPPWTRYLLYDR